MIRLKLGLSNTRGRGGDRLASRDIPWRNERISDLGWALLHGRNREDVVVIEMGELCDMRLDLLFLARIYYLYEA